MQNRATDSRRGYPCRTQAPKRVSSVTIIAGLIRLHPFCPEDGVLDNVPLTDEMNARSIEPQD